jgi:FkbM family methyltransferase
MDVIGKRPSDTELCTDARVLQCCVSYNRYGGFCVPKSSEYRPAARRILAGAVWEPDTIEFMVNHAGGGDIVHAGAYFGDFIPALSRACDPSAKVWAFEPNPENYRCALITIEINGLKNVAIRNAGLGSQNAVHSMRVADEDGRALGGGSRMVASAIAGNSEHTKQVDILRLDGLIPADRKVAIIQLDVEGFEQHALNGAMRTIRRCKPLLILETLPKHAWLAEKLLSLGYQITGKVHANTVLTNL